MPKKMFNYFKKKKEVIIPIDDNNSMVRLDNDDSFNDDVLEKSLSKSVELKLNCDNNEFVVTNDFLIKCKEYVDKKQSKKQEAKIKLKKDDHIWYFEHGGGVESNKWTKSK